MKKLETAIPNVTAEDLAGWWYFRNLIKDFVQMNKNLTDLSTEREERMKGLDEKAMENAQKRVSEIKGEIVAQRNADIERIGREGKGAIVQYESPTEKELLPAELSKLKEGIDSWYSGEIFPHKERLMKLVKKLRFNFSEEMMYIPKLLTATPSSEENIAIGGMAKDSDGRMRIIPRHMVLYNASYRPPGWTWLHFPMFSHKRIRFENGKGIDTFVEAVSDDGAQTTPGSLEWLNELKKIAEAEENE